MLKKRLIACLFLKNGHLVRSEQFSYHQLLGDPLHQVDRLNAWAVDELIYCDISDSEHYDLRRDDMKVKRMNSLHDIIAAVAERSFVPLTVGGGIDSVEEIAERLRLGADKVVITTAAVANPDLITQAAKTFGSQCIVAGIDVRGVAGGYEVFVSRGTVATGMDPVSWAKQLQKLGAGEIFLNVIDRDGAAEGYDLPLVKSVVDAVQLPVIACGGVGTFEHFVEGIIDGGASAVAAGNIFNYTENCVIRAKKKLEQAGLPVRPVVRPERKKRKRRR